MQEGNSPHAQLVGRVRGITSMEGQMAGISKITNACLHWPSNSHLGIYSRDRVIQDFHCSIIYNSKKIGDYLSAHEQGLVNCGIPYSSKKEGKPWREPHEWCLKRGKIEYICIFKIYLNYYWVNTREITVITFHGVRTGPLGHRVSWREIFVVVYILFRV